MAQITSGVRAILSVPLVYSVLQSIVGTGKSKTRFINEHLKITDGDRILDIGCGTGMLLDYLPSTVRYVGFDSSEAYISHAKRKYGVRGQFFRGKVENSSTGELNNFDRVVAIGVLHHLDDQEAIKLFDLARKALKPNSGEFHSIDPCYVPDQSTISRFLVSRDRGKNVRVASGYESLALEVFSDVVVRNRNDMLRVPYDHAILRCK